MAFSPEPLFGKFAQSKSQGSPAYLQKKKQKKSSEERQVTI